MPELPEVETSRRGIEPHLVVARLFFMLPCVTVASVGRFLMRSMR